MAINPDVAFRVANKLTDASVSLNRGFRDQRTPAELSLDPEPPLSLQAAPKPPGKFGKFLGAVGKAGSMTSGAFSNARLAIAATQESVALSVSLASSAAGFASAGNSLLSGHTSIRDAAVFGSSVASAVQIDAGGFHISADLAQFSGMRSGVSLAGSAAFSAQLSQRQAQIAHIATAAAAIAAATIAIGVIIKENRKRKPNPQKDDIDRPNIPRLAMGGSFAEVDVSLSNKRKFVVAGVTIGAGTPSFWSRSVLNALNPLKSFKKLPGFNAQLNMSFADKSRLQGWSEPAPPYAAQYPHNHCQQTASGLLWEMDDTPGGERVHIMHRSGSLIEMHPNGKVVYKSMSHCYQITMADHHVKVKGDCHLNVEGDATIHVKGKVKLDSDDDILMRTKKDFNVHADNINLRANKTAKLDGRLIDLRYAKLPGIPVMTMSGPAVRLIRGEIARDYPKMAAEMEIQEAAQKAHVIKYVADQVTNLAVEKTTTAAMASYAAAVNPSITLGDPTPSIFAKAMAVAHKVVNDRKYKDTIDAIRIVQMLVGLIPPDGSSLTPGDSDLDTAELTAEQEPRENPLGNPLIYHAQTQSAIDYRALLFDTPNEIDDAEHYQAHIDTCKALKDMPENTGPALEGVLTDCTTDRDALAALPLINYLTRADYLGHMDFTPATRLGGTTWTVGELVDTFSQPDVTIFVDQAEPEIDLLAGFVSGVDPTEDPTEDPTGDTTE